jgi:hypothetical protein
MLLSIMAQLCFALIKNAVCIGFATRLRSTDMAWAAMGGGHERRSDWGYSVASDELPTKMQLVSWAHGLGFGGSDSVIHLWKQKLEHRYRLLRVRRSIMEFSSVSLPVSPSKFNFVPEPGSISSPEKQQSPIATSQLLQVVPSFKAL